MKPLQAPLKKLFTGTVVAVAIGMSSIASAADTIKVGILHSLSGTMAISETTLKDTMLMLIEEQNKKGGLLGKTAGTGGGGPRFQLAAVRREGP